MAKKTEKSKLKKIIEEELHDMDDEPKDEAFEPTIIKSATEEAYDSEERVIDELLATVPHAQGYYLKLYKELRPNDFEMKLRIDNYELWTDLELEITNIVRAYTLESPKKWGSGRYKIVVWREGGVRGHQHKPRFFYVDAMEKESDETHINVPTGNATENMNEQLSMLTGLMSVIRQANPTLTPEQIQKNITESFQQGLSIAARSEAAESNSNNNMMTQMLAMITTLMGNKPDPVAPPDPTAQMGSLVGMLSNLGIVNKKSSGDEGIIKTIAMLKELGLVNSPGKQDNSPLGQLEGIKDIITVVKGITGIGGDTHQPSAMEKIIDVLGPKLPEIVGKFTNTIDGAIELKKMQIMGPQPRRMINPGEPGFMPTVHSPEEEMMHGYEPTPETADDQQQNLSFFDGPVKPSHRPMQPASESLRQPVPGQGLQPKEEPLHPLLGELKTIVESHDTTRFNDIKNMTFELDGGSGKLFEGIASGEMKEDDLLSTLMSLGGRNFRQGNFPHKLKAIIDEFVTWCKSPDARGLVAHCSKCNAEYEYETEEFYRTDSQLCEETHEGRKCEGTIMLDVKGETSPSPEEVSAGALPTDVVAEG